ncbi:hypothetical protein JCM8097_001437 [Rhodosporidiobolus ruineniae]
MSSYGTSLPDSEQLIHARCSSHLALLPQLASFLSQLSQTQRDASQKLSAQVGQFRRALASSAPERTGGGGLEQTATLELALGRVFEQLDLQVREMEVVADRVGREVSMEADKVGARLDAVRKKHHTHYTKLLAVRDAAYHQRDKSRSAYYSACEALESARQKKQGAKEGRDAEKAQRGYDERYVEMEIAKDQYLLDLDTANTAKSALYDEHLPALSDAYQVLEASSVRQLTALLDRMVAVHRESGERVLASVAAAAEAVATVQVEQDQAAFVQRYEPTVLGAFEKPPDLVFEESPVWHDTNAFSTTPPCITYLQNVKMKSEARVGEMAPEIEAKRKEAASLENLRASYEAQPGLGDTVGVVENLFTTSHALSLLEITTSLHSAEVALIDSTLGDSASTGLRPHEFKEKSFVTPSTCAVCDGSVWGKGLQCKKCSMAVHAKCELKVPAGCGARPGAGIVRAKSKKTGAGGTTSPQAMSPTPSSAGSFSSLSTTSTSLPPPRRTVPPSSLAGDALPPMPSTSRPSPSGGGGGGTPAVLLYDYEAQSEGELSVSEGDPVLVLVPEDASGWVKVRRDADGREGLVPGSYLQISEEGGAAGAGGAGLGARGGGGRRVVALYDYAPQAADELALREGEEAELTATGMGAGDGWAEITKNGQTGIVPSSYIQLI